MKIGTGLPVFPGVSIGAAVVYRKSQQNAAPVSSGDPAAEQAKFDAAVVTARNQLSALYEKAKAELGEEKAAIVEVQMLTTWIIWTAWRLPSRAALLLPRQHWKPARSSPPCLLPWTMNT